MVAPRPAAAPGRAGECGRGSAWAREAGCRAEPWAASALGGTAAGAPLSSRGPGGLGSELPRQSPPTPCSAAPAPGPSYPTSARLGLFWLRKQTGREEEGGGAQPLPSQAWRHQEVGVLAPTHPLTQAPDCRALWGRRRCPTARPAQPPAGLISPLSCPQRGRPSSCCQWPPGRLSRSFGPGTRGRVLALVALMVTAGLSCVPVDHVRCHRRVCARPLGE